MTPREVVQAHLDRISAVNPQLNAIVTLMADDALRSADAAGQAALSGAPLRADYFEHYDVLLCPVNPFTAWHHSFEDVVVNGVTVCCCTKGCGLSAWKLCRSLPQPPVAIHHCC